MVPKKLSFEQPYDDYSGARLSVALETVYLFCDGERTAISIATAGDRVDIETTDLDFVINSLIKIRTALEL